MSTKLALIAFVSLIMVIAITVFVVVKKIRRKKTTRGTAKRNIETRRLSSTTSNSDSIFDVSIAYRSLYYSHTLPRMFNYDDDNRQANKLQAEPKSLNGFHNGFTTPSLTMFNDNRTQRFHAVDSDRGETHSRSRQVSDNGIVISLAASLLGTSNRRDVRDRDGRQKNSNYDKIMPLLTASKYQKHSKKIPLDLRESGRECSPAGEPMNFPQSGRMLF
jgi:hypothetical protein